MCHDYFKQVLTTSPFGGEVPQMFLSLTATRFFGSHDSCHDFLDYANYAHFAMNSYNNDVKTITPDLNSLWKHLHCIPDSRKTTLFRKVAIGIRRKTPQIIERGEDLVASFDENLRPGRTYQVPHHTHISTKHGLAYILLGFKGITAFIMMTLPSLQ